MEWIEWSRLIALSINWRFQKEGFKKKVKMADNLGLNGLVVSAGKCAGPIPAENCTSCRK